MNYLIRHRRYDEPVPYDLLLLGDENQALIDTYLPTSQLYVLELEGMVVGVGVLRISNVTGEVMNIAVAPEYQGKGLGRAMLRALVEAAEQQHAERLMIATGNSGIGQLALYQQEGFDLMGMDRDYFLRHYDEPIWENNIRCRHQLILQKMLTPATATLVRLRRATHQDVNVITELFYDTITRINASDYSDEQVVAWRSGSQHVKGWLQRIDNQCFLVAVRHGAIVGFGSVTLSGYVDLLFVHSAHQRLGIASQLMDALETVARHLFLTTITADVSLTARPFFEKRGFRVVAEQEVIIHGVTLANVKMRKSMGET